MPVLTAFRFILGKRRTQFVTVLLQTGVNQMSNFVITTPRLISSWVLHLFALTWKVVLLLRTFQSRCRKKRVLTLRDGLTFISLECHRLLTMVILFTVLFILNMTPTRLTTLVQRVRHSL